MKVGPVLFLAALPVALHAQSQASLGVGVGTVRYAGGSSFSAATVSPAVQLLSPSFYVGAGGSLSMLKDGVWAGQGRADLWAAFPRDRTAGVRVAVGANVAASTRSDGVAAAAGSVVAELMWTTGRGGGAIGVGPTTGVIEGERSVTAPHLRARGWWLTGPAQLSLSVEPTRFVGAWYTDVVGGATVDRGGGASLRRSGPARGSATPTARREPRARRCSTSLRHRWPSRPLRGAISPTRFKGCHGRGL